VTKKHNIKIELEEMMWKRRIKSVSQLSRMTGLSRSTITRLLKGEADQIGFDTLEKLCNALQCDVTDLIVRRKDKVS
jgi:putative transcriptional regulator